MSNSELEKELYLIVAMTRNRVIGKGDELPWRIPEELRKFKELTYGNSIIMGRKTFNSIGRPLPGRQNIVISNTLDSMDGLFVATSIESAISIANSSKIFFIGGREIYVKALALVDFMYISLIKDEYAGDIYFPEISINDWDEIECTEFAEFYLKKYKRMV